MIYLNFNFRGLANPIKILALKDLLSKTLVDALFLKETTGDGTSINTILDSILPN